MRATSWRDIIWQQAVRLLPPDTAVPHPAKAARPDFGLHSLDFVEVVLEVEQHFGFRFSTAQLEDLRAAQLVLNSAAPPLRRPLYAAFFAQLMQQGDWLDR